jgi:hypothetical protein
MRPIEETAMRDVYGSALEMVESSLRAAADDCLAEQSNLRNGAPLDPDAIARAISLAEEGLRRLKHVQQCANLVPSATANKQASTPSRSGFV